MKQKKGEETQVTITNQGGPRFNTAFVSVLHDDIAVVEIDMKSKYHEECARSSCHQEGPELAIGPANGSLHLEPGKEHKVTWLQFDDFVGWSILAVTCGRYTIEVIMTPPYENRRTDKHAQDGREGQ